MSDPMILRWRGPRSVVMGDSIAAVFAPVLPSDPTIVDLQAQIDELRALIEAGGGGGGGGTYAPSLDFSDARNSQYVPLFFDDF